MDRSCPTKGDNPVNLVSIQGSAGREWYKRRTRQILSSIPHYISELGHIRSFRQAYDWIYFKLPYLFKLKEFPPRATVEFTNQCNFGCGYCPRSVMSRTVGFMDVSFFKHFVRELEEGGCAVLKIGGLGEPALHTRFQELMGCLDSCRMQVFLYTNGTLLQRFPLEEICRWNLYTVVLSVDGLDKESFEKLRKNGIYQDVRDAAARFHNFKCRRKPILEIRHVMMSNETAADLHAFRRDWLRYADTVKFNYLIPTRPGPSTVPSKVRCRDIRREVYVRWDGRALLCAGQENQPCPEWLGNITQTSLSKLWFSDRLEQLRFAHSHRCGQLPNCCQNCAFR